MKDLGENAVIRWEVRTLDPLLPRSVIAQVFPQAIGSSKVMHEVLDEERRGHPLMEAAVLIVRRIFRTVLSASLLLFAFFSALWFLGRLFGHSPGLMIFIYGLVAWLTGYALYQGIAGLMSPSHIERHRKASNVRVAGFLSLPLLMYATACPTMTAFRLGDSEVPPEFLDWSVFYAYMLFDVLTLGIPQGLFGELASFKPPSLFAAFSTFWAKTLMLIGVISVIVGTLRDALARSYTFVGTLSEFREWAELRFGHPSSTSGTGGRIWWRRLIFGKVQRRYEVVPVAVERLFDGESRGRVLTQFQRRRWRIGEDGTLSCPDLKEGESLDSDEEEPVQEPIRKTIANLLFFGFMLFAFGWAIFIYMGLLSLPAYLLLYYGADLSQEYAIGFALLTGLFFISVDWMVRERNKSMRFLTLSRVRDHALLGTEAVPPKELGRILTRSTKGPVTQVMQFLNLRRLFSPMFGESKKAFKPEPATSRPKLPSGESYYSILGNPGGTEIICGKEWDTVWIVHNWPFANQGAIDHLFYDTGESRFIAVGAGGEAEHLDTASVPEGDKILQTVSDRAVTLLARDNQPPSSPEDIQEFPLRFGRWPASSPILHVHSERARQGIQVDFEDAAGDEMT